MLELLFKKLSEDVQLPTKAHSTDACFDIYAPRDVTLDPRTITKVELDFAVQCPSGYKLCFYSRSSMGGKGILLANSVGIIDEDYRGMCLAAFYNGNAKCYHIKKGDRILQCALEKVIPFDIKVVDDLTETERGSGGFGSSGR